MHMHFIVKPVKGFGKSARNSGVPRRGLEPLPLAYDLRNRA